RAVRGQGAVGALAVELKAPADFGFDKLRLETLRLHLSAESNLATTLYELLCNNLVQVVVRDPTPGSTVEPIILPPSALRPIGFAEDEGILPYTKRSFVGYRLLQEYFAFPEKFLFFDLSGLERLRSAGLGSSAELVFLFSSFERAERREMLEAAVSADTVRLNCAPIVNLFPHTSEPILLDQKHYEYRVVPDARHRTATGVYSIEEVVAVTPDAEEPVRFEPF